MNHGTNKTIILGVDDFATLTGLTLEPSLEIINLVKTMNIEWKHVIQCIRHEMSPLISTSLEAALTSLVFGNADSPKMKDLSATFVDRVLNAMAQSLTLSNKEATYIKFAVQRAIKYGEIHENKEGTGKFPHIHVHVEERALKDAGQTLAQAWDECSSLC